mgnify:CR=1 FL=1
MRALIFVGLVIAAAMPLFAQDQSIEAKPNQLRFALIKTGTSSALEAFTSACGRWTKRVEINLVDFPHAEVWVQKSELDFSLAKGGPTVSISQINSASPGL